METNEKRKIKALVIVAIGLLFGLYFLASQFRQPLERTPANEPPYQCQPYQRIPLKKEEELGTHLPEYEPHVKDSFCW